MQTCNPYFLSHGKRAVYILILLLSITNLYGQNVTITIGRGTNCFGRGACSITTNKLEQTQSYNATFIYNSDGTVVLRAFRSKLTVDEQNRLLNSPISAKETTEMKFIQAETLLLSEDLKQNLEMSSIFLETIDASSYSATVTPKYIDIILLEKK